MPLAAFTVWSGNHRGVILSFHILDSYSQAEKTDDGAQFLQGRVVHNVYA